MKILSIHDLATIRKRAEHNLSLREESQGLISEQAATLQHPAVRGKYCKKILQSRKTGSSSYIKK